LYNVNQENILLFRNIFKSHLLTVLHCHLLILIGWQHVIDLFCQVVTTPLLCAGRTMVINVEYNQLDPLLRATGHPDGDANCETGYSPYPGNINQVQYI
jgi:hypothetical protein